MIAAVSIPSLAYIVASVVALCLTHVLLSRRQMAGRRPISPQTSLARLILTLNVPVLAGTGVITWLEARPSVEIVSMLVFNAIVYNGIAYAYFHTFNMSETARRIRILLYVLTHNDVSAEHLHGEYSPRDIVSLRLDRLEQMSQIARGPDGRFHINRKLLLFFAHILRAWRRLLRFECNPAS